MSWIRRMEGALERCIEGFFNEKFAGTLQPVEVLQQLIKAMLDQASLRMAPDCYSVFLHPEEAARFSDDADLLTELETCLQKEAKENGLKFACPPEIKLLEDKGLAHGCIRVKAEFKECAALEEEPDELHSTLIFDRIEASPALIKFAAKRASLSVIKGSDLGRCVELEGGRVNIGRLQSNELVLSDQSSSRLHAYVCWSEDKRQYLLYDAQSLNGTKLNQRNVIEAVLQDGDKISIGNTELKYEEKK